MVEKDENENNPTPENKKAGEEYPLLSPKLLTSTNLLNLLQNVFQNLELGLIIGNQVGEIIFINPAAARLFGYPSNGIPPNLTLAGLFQEADISPGFLENVAQGRSFAEETIEIRLKTARRTYFRLKVTPLFNGENRFEGVMGVIKSPEDNRSREKEQKNLARLSTISRLISAVAHEINNPLQTVKTSLELARDPQKSQERRLDYFKTADREINRIALIINQMRSFYRPNPGKKQTVKINEKIQKALVLLEPALKKAGVEVELELEDALPVLYILEYQLEQVFLNLIARVLDNLNPGDHLLVSSRLEEANWIIIEFKSLEGKLRPYNPTLKPELPENKTGTGPALGLSISKEIITELGGYVMVSPPPEGIIRITLPY